MATTAAQTVGTAARQAAPGDLELVRSFLNTRDVEQGTDELATPEGLRTWLTDRGLLDPDVPVTVEERHTTLALREGLRALALANNGVAPDRKTLDRLDQASGDLTLRVKLSDDELRLVPPDRGVKGALATLVGIVYDSMHAGTWARLKACRNDECLWLFYDHSKNRSGTWCTMAVCGNVMKARAYRRRRKED
ncbi:MAG: CGNR zinc finger domain-containing protein [Actinomycetota bacterium]|nr:CGNR zinc finger domain-containing protein [Actinomycetota bacterium]